MTSSSSPTSPSSSATCRTSGSGGVAADDRPGATGRLADLDPHGATTPCAAPLDEAGDRCRRTCRAPSRRAACRDRRVDEFVEVRALDRQAQRGPDRDRTDRPGSRTRARRRRRPRSPGRRPASKGSPATVSQQAQLEGLHEPVIETGAARRSISPAGRTGRRRSAPRPHERATARPTACRRFERPGRRRSRACAS